MFFENFSLLWIFFNILNFLSNRAIAKVELLIGNFDVFFNFILAFFKVMKKFSLIFLFGGEPVHSF